MDIFSKLGFDLNSLIMYVINMGLLFAIIYFLLYPKIIHFLDERRKIIANSIDEANQLKTIFEKKLKDIEREQQRSKKAMETEMETLRVMIDAKREELLREIEEERFRMLEQVHKNIELKKERMLQEAEQRALELMKSVIAHVVSTSIPEELIQKSVTESWKQKK